VNPAANINEALGEKDILLYSIAENGALQWSRTYGGADRDKGIGVKYNNDNGFSISAFTTSPYFGNIDASFDPLFIKTDSVGIVGCQMFSPPLQEVGVSLNVVTAGSNQSIAIANDVPAINYIDYLPNDQYVCQSCTSIPQFSISDTTVCVNDSVFLSNTTIVGLTCFQQWNVNGTFINGQVNPGYAFSTPGVYQIFLYSSCGLNSDTMIRNIYVIDPITTVPDLICTSAAATPFLATPPNGIWNGQNLTTNGIFTPGNLNTGQYLVTYTIPDYCAVSDSFLLVEPPIIAGNDTLICLGQSIPLNAVSPAGNQFQWNVNVPNGGNYSPLSFGSFDLYATVTDTNGCLNSDTLILSTHPIPQANFTYLVDCNSTNVTLTNTSLVDPIFNDQLNGSWIVNGNSEGNQNSITYDYGASGPASATLIVVSNPGNCNDTISQSFIVPTNPTGSFTYVQHCDYIADFSGEFPSNENITSIVWSAQGTSFGVDLMQTSYYFGASGDYNVNLAITNDYPCTYNINQVVSMIIEESLEEQTVPNIITADGDGINDQLNLDLWLDECLEYRIELFNRWGNLVYAFSRNESPFSGLDTNGNELVPGIYFYKLIGGDSQRHGHVTLIR
jgi:gliding motility-associated-like protein